MGSLPRPGLAGTAERLISLLKRALLPRKFSSRLRPDVLPFIFLLPVPNQDDGYDLTSLTRGRWSDLIKSGPYLSASPTQYSSSAKPFTEHNLQDQWMKSFVLQDNENLDMTDCQAELRQTGDCKT